MKKIKMLVLFLVLFGTIPSFAQQTNTIISKERPSDYEFLSVPDSTGYRTPLKKPSSNHSQQLIAQQLILPYPIIFIHGLNSESDGCWDNATIWMDLQYNTTFGGRFDFCLNYDGDYSLANQYFWPTAGADLALFTPTLIAGDYYYLNFDVALDGMVHPNSSYSYYCESNQQAVAKQALALKNAISMVLQETGRDKVVLMAHSMGGLAAREYLQNPILWQPDGQTHVAKLVTTGTPHGGSNASLSILSTFASINNQSEAVRDLRTSYFYSNDPGVYLFGGYESNAVMADVFATNFDNVDVNCNGTTGEYITGLNQKNIYTNLDYACIIGTANPLNGGDGVVDNEMADLNNYYTGLTTNLFPVSVLHTSLPNQFVENMQGLDEPNEYNLSYNIDFDTSYTAFTTMQPIGGYPLDYDDYQFTLPANGSVIVSINNIALSNLMVHILDLSYSTVGVIHYSSGFPTINYTQTLNAGSYYLEIYGAPTLTSYLYPYDFVLQQTTTTGIKIFENIDNIIISPNPSAGIFSISSNSNINDFEISVVNILGEEIYKTKMISNTTELDLSNQQNGVYFVKINSNENSITKRIIISK